MEKNIFIDMMSLQDSFGYDGKYYTSGIKTNYSYTRRVLRNFINILHNSNVNIYLFINIKQYSLYRDGMYKLAELQDLHIKDTFIIYGDKNDTKIFKFITGKHFSKSIIAYNNKHSVYTKYIKSCELAPVKYAVKDIMLESIYKILKYFSIEYDKGMLEMNIKFKTKEESLLNYSKYVDDHIKNVIDAYTKYKDILSSYTDLRSPGDLSHLSIDIKKHDASKYLDEEFYPYAAKFYTSEEDDLANIQANFDAAWKHHYTYNKHHPEFWVCKNKLTGKNIITRMDNASFIEMLCDWIAMSMNFKQSLYVWWFENDGGRKEKSTLLTVEDVKIIDKIIIENKDTFDFRVK